MEKISKKEIEKFGSESEKRKREMAERKEMTIRHDVHFIERGAEEGGAAGAAAAGGEAKVEAEEMKNQEKEQEQQEEEEADGNAKRPSSSAEIVATAGPVRRRERHMHARLKRTALQFLCNIYMGSQDVRKVPAQDRRWMKVEAVTTVCTLCRLRCLLQRK